MSDPSKSSVPRFASFRPKTAARDNATENDKLELEERHTSHRKRDRSQEQIHDGHKLKKSYHDSRSSANDRNEGSERHRVEDGHPRQRHHGRQPAHDLTTPVDYEDGVFQIDRKGDVQNLQYGKLHRYSIPSYRRSGHGFVVGLGNAERIERTDDDQLVVKKKIGTKKDRPDYGSQRWQDSRSVRFIRPQDSTHHFDPSEDFISATSNQKRQRVQSLLIDDAQISLREEALSRIGPQKDAPLESDVEYVSDSSNDSDLGEYDNQTKLENARLIRLTETDPTDAKAWQALIDHQASMLYIGRGARDYAFDANDERALADVRGSIYERAVRVVPDGEAHVQLIIRYMDTVAKIWESKRLSDRWHSLLQQYPHSIELWLVYLDFVQTNFKEYRFESCKAIYHTCFEILSQLSSGRSAHRPIPEHLQRLSVYVITRLTFMAREAGYSELSTAVWQAALEYVILKPTTVQFASTVDKLSAFEEFWESEVARIGEVEACGWRSYSVATAQPAADQRELTLATSAKSLDRWRHIEAEGDRLLHRPGRTSDELGADDPYHVVLFSDLKLLMAALPQDLMPQRLIQGYLWFVGLPQLADGDMTLVDLLTASPFLQNQVWDSTTGIDVAFRYYRIVQTSPTLLEQSFLGQAGSEQTEWTRRTLDLLTKALPEEPSLAEYYLAFLSRLQETDHSTSQAAKTAKRVLKARPNNLRLYNAYAMIEARRGKGDFETILAKALTMSDAFSHDDQLDATLLWRTWAWKVLANGDMHKSRQILNSIGRTRLDLPAVAAVEPSSETMLRSSRVLVEMRDQALSARRTSLAILAIECQSLLHYLQTKSTALEAAMAIFRQADAMLQERHLAGTYAHEALHQARAELLMWHMNHARSYKPTVIREAMAESVRLFPRNTLLLAGFVNSEARFRIDNRVRTMVSNVVANRGEKQQETVIAHIFAIATEMESLKVQTGTKYAVRAAFERAVGSKVGEHCAALWHAYLHFELDTASAGADLAREVFFKGITKLPWCKAFMMEAFEDRLRRHMSEEQLMRVYNIMEEKELRLFGSLHSD